MHVHIDYHRKVVGLLLVALLMALVLVAALVIKVGFFNPAEPQADKYLQGEEAVVITPALESRNAVVVPIQKVLFKYIEIVDSCGPYFQGDCLNVRSGPGENFPVITRLRNSIVLKISGKVEYNDSTWYKIVFDEWLRYPERITDDWYVSADFVKVLLDEGVTKLTKESKSTDKKIIVDRSDQKLYAYNGKELFMEETISTGLELTPTPRGVFTIFKKTPSRYMQGPIPGITQKEYDLPGVPWNLYFTAQGAVIHGTYWHEKFGKQASNGCVNVTPERARELYDWTDIGTRVIVRD